MSLEKQDPGSTRHARSSDGDLLREQREANEMLVLATIQAGEDADSARSAQEAAETASGALRAREADLHAMADFRERLMGIVGHDLRSPLNTILMGSGLLIARGDLTEADAQLVTRIVDSGQRMARMISHLLDFTQARLGGGFALTLAPTDLAAICRDIAEELRISSSAEISLELAGELTGTWDTDRLSEVVSNLLGNAIDHSASGTSVVLRVRADDGTVVIEVTNEGAGISPELLPVIFEAFRRADGPRAAPKGEHMGLGLYISSEIVRSHGGSIEAHSAAGTTTFTVRLPRVAAPRPAA